MIDRTAVIAALDAVVDPKSGQGLVAASIYIRSLESSLESANARRAFEKGSAMLESTSVSIRNMLNSLNREPKE